MSGNQFLEKPYAKFSVGDKVQVLSSSYVKPWLSGHANPKGNLLQDFATPVSPINSFGGAVYDSFTMTVSKIWVRATEDAHGMDFVVFYQMEECGDVRIREDNLIAVNESKGVTLPGDLQTPLFIGVHNDVCYDLTLETTGPLIDLNTSASLGAIGEFSGTGTVRTVWFSEDRIECDTTLAFYAVKPASARVVLAFTANNWEASVSKPEVIMAEYPTDFPYGVSLQQGTVSFFAEIGKELRLLGIEEESSDYIWY